MCMWRNTLGQKCTHNLNLAICVSTAHGLHFYLQRTVPLKGFVHSRAAILIGWFQNVVFYKDCWWMDRVPSNSYKRDMAENKPRNIT